MSSAWLTAILSASMSPSAGSVNIADAPPLSATITRSSGVARCNISHASRAASSDDSSGTGWLDATTHLLLVLRPRSAVAADPCGITAIPSASLSPMRRSISSAIPSDAFPTASSIIRDAPRNQTGNLLRTTAAAVHRATDEPRRIDRRNRSAINLFEISPLGILRHREVVPKSGSPSTRGRG